VALKKKNIKLDDISDWLQKQDAYTLHQEAFRAQPI